MNAEKLIFLLTTLPEGRARGRYELLLKDQLSRPSALEQNDERKSPKLYDLDALEQGKGTRTPMLHTQVG
jgi:hypothetical protein